MTSLEREISAAVAELPAEQQQVVTLCDLEGYTLQETANILGVALGTVKSRLNRAHGRLRDRLRERNFSPGNVVLSDAAPITEPAGWATRSADDGL